MVKNPNIQVNAINETNSKASAAPIASSASVPSFIPSGPDKNGPIVTKVQNHTHNGNNHLAVNEQKKVCVSNLKSIFYESYIDCYYFFFGYTI